MSLVLAVADGWPHTFRCLMSLAEHCRGVAHEVIVVADATSDETALALPRLEGVRFLVTPERQGLVRARNEGARLARGRWLAFLGNGVEARPGWLKSLLAEAEADGRVAAIGSGLVGLDGQTEVPELARASGVETPLLSADGLLVRSDAFRSAGGFDEAFQERCADADLCLRLAESGRRVAHAPESQLRLHEPLGMGVPPTPADHLLLLQRWESLLDPCSKSPPVPPSPELRLEAGALIRALGGESLEGRARENFRLALELSAAGDNLQARPFIARAFLLLGGAREILPLFESIHLALGDFSAIRAARKRVGMNAAAAGNVSRAIADFNDWQYTDAQLRGQDSYEFDDDVLAALRRLAEPFRQPPRFTAPLPGRRLRVAHLVFGTTQQNSVIVRISRLFARFQDRTRFETAFFVPESHAQVARSAQGTGHLAFFQEQGSQALATPDQGTPAERMVWLAQAIRDFGPDLLVMNAALADFHHYFVMSMTPAPATLGFVSGPPPQFAAPELDHGISWTWHTLMDAPIPCSRVPLETDLPDPARLALRPRAALGIPEDAVLLAAAGRSLKHRSPRFWRLVLALLERFPEAHFLCIGATEDQLPEVSPLLGGFRERIHFAPWMDAYLEVFGQADVVLDTFPSGGGVALTDVIALGRPVVAFQNDYRRSFDQTDWNPAHEFLPDCELVVPRGDDRRFLEVVGRLIADPAYRSSLGDRCREAVLGQRGSPERMVRRCEAVFEKVIAEKASGHLQG